MKPIITRLHHWLTWKTVCAWCKPQRRIKGAPWAQQITHGMCKTCYDKAMKGIPR